jgi:hypothetical protein
MASVPVRCSRPIVHAVGEIAVAFGNLELYVSGAIWQLLGISDKTVEQLAQAITAEMSFDRKVHAFASMYKIRFPADATNPDLKKLVARLFEVQDLRNQVLHSNWPEPDDETERLRVKSSAKTKSGLKTSVSAVTADDMFGIVKAIHEVGQDFGKFALQRIQNQLCEPTKPS